MKLVVVFSSVLSICFFSLITIKHAAASAPGACQIASLDGEMGGGNTCAGSSPLPPVSPPVPIGALEIRSVLKDEIDKRLREKQEQARKAQEEKAAKEKAAKEKAAKEKAAKEKAAKEKAAKEKAAAFEKAIYKMLHPDVLNPFKQTPVKPSVKPTSPTRIGPRLPKFAKK